MSWYGINDSSSFVTFFTINTTKIIIIIAITVAIMIYVNFSFLFDTSTSFSCAISLLTVILYVTFLSSPSPFTVIVIIFSPSCKFSLPVISTFAFSSVAIALISNVFKSDFKSAVYSYTSVLN